MNHAETHNNQPGVTMAEQRELKVRRGLVDVLRAADTRPREGCWALGDYFNKCMDCGNLFVGDKRALSCAPCAYNDKPDGDEPTPDQ